mmetsp:Transcript_20177/g.50211  ORF Transcript_20177/g.50211 Transcript_20177/m.50211 type:complete len:320 (+) Transcript_20177:102-1061(+)
MKESSDDSAPEHPQISVVLLAGLPASGKSTLARKLKKRFNPDDDSNNNQENIARLIHIEYDDLEDGLLSSPDSEEDDIHGNDDDEIETRRRDAWNQARQRAVEKMEEEIQNIKDTPCTNNRIILMDDNFHLRGMRKQIHRLLLTFKPIRFGILYLTTPLEVCLERNHKRSGIRKIPTNVIEKMTASLEPPRVAWEVASTMTIVDSDTSFEEIVEFLIACPEIIDLPEVDLEQQASDRATTRKNEIHSLDKRLRTYVGKVAKFDKSLAKSANLARKTVLEDVKACRIELEVVTRAFLDSIVPDSSSNSTIRFSLQEILEG